MTTLLADLHRVYLGGIETSGGTIIGLFVVSQQVFAPPSKLGWWRSPKSVKNDLALHTYFQSEFYHPVQSPVTHRIHNPTSIALLRWQYENRKELEKHMVLRRVDWVRDENVGAIVDRYSVVNNGETALASVLVNKEGLFLHDTSGESPCKRMSSSQFIDRERIGGVDESRKSSDGSIEMEGAIRFIVAAARTSPFASRK